MIIKTLFDCLHKVICVGKRDDSAHFTTSYDLSIPLLLGNSYDDDTIVETICLSKQATERDDDDDFYSAKKVIESKMKMLEMEADDSKRSYITDYYNTLTAIAGEYKDKLLLDQLNLDESNVYHAKRVTVENSIQKEKLKEVDNLLQIEKPASKQKSKPAKQKVIEQPTIN